MEKYFKENNSDISFDIIFDIPIDILLYYYNISLVTLKDMTTTPTTMIQYIYYLI